MNLPLLLFRKRFHAYVDFAFRELYPNKCFMDHWHIELMAEVLQLHYEHADQKELGRMIFNLPPGYFKTHLCSIFFPTWVLGRDPRLTVLIISETVGKAYDLQERCADLMSKPRFRSLFPRAKIKSIGKSVEFNYGGCIHHSSLHYTGVRRKSDIVIIDNPQSILSLERLDPQSLIELPRLLKDPKRGLIIMNSRRLSGNDMTHHLSRLSGWSSLSLPLVAVQDELIQIAPYLRHDLKMGEVLQREIADWFDVETNLQEMGWKHFSFQQMQDCYKLDTHDHTYDNRRDENGFRWVMVGELSDDQIAHQEFKKLREHYEQKRVEAT